MTKPIAHAVAPTTIMSPPGRIELRRNAAEAATANPTPRLIAKASAKPSMSAEKNGNSTRTRLTMSAATAASVSGQVFYGELKDRIAH